MLAFAIFAGLVLGLPVIGLLPPMRRGRAFNAITYIAMPVREQYGTRWTPVLAQEVAEWWAAWAGAFLLALPLSLAVATFTPFGLATPLLAIVAWRWRTTTWGERQLEYIGWAAEWVHGLKASPGDYRDLLSYTDRMRRGYPDLFGEMTAKEARDRLEARIGLARLLVGLLALRIRRASS